jgi:hypothetical protein
MEPRRDNATTSTSTAKQKKEKGRFQIVKLEDRIAPRNGAHGSAHAGCHSGVCTAAGVA